MRAWVALVVAVAGCDSVFGIDGPDAAVGDASDAPAVDGAGDAGVVPCAMWGPPAVRNEFMTNRASPTLTDDQRELWVTALGNPDNLLAGTRLMQGAYTVALEPLLNSGNDDTEPSLAGDGLNIVWLSTRNGTPAQVIEAQRPLRAAAWNMAAAHDELDGASPPVSVELSSDARTIYIVRADGDLSASIRARPPEPFSSERVIATGTNHPSISRDERVLYYDDGASLHRRERAAPDAMFLDATDVDLGIAGTHPEISADGSTLVFIGAGGAVRYVECL